MRIKLKQDLSYTENNRSVSFVDAAFQTAESS